MDFTQLLAKLSVLEGKADEPAAPDSDAVARRKRLDALRDRQEEREEGEGTKSNKRFVAGKAYGGANQKDDEDLEESKEECNQSAEGKECPVHGMEECSGYMEEGAKPDFLDMDKDGDKKEPMKKAVKDKEDDKELEEGAKPDFLDMDKDGDTKEPMKKAVKDKEDDKELEECYDGSMSAMGSEDQNSGMNINTSIDTHTGRKTLSVTADGEAAEELMQMLKLSGIGGQGAQAEAPDAVQAVQPQGQPSMADHIKVVSVPLAHQEGGFKMGGEEEVEEEYSNEPDPQVQPVDVQLHQGNDLNREKKMTKHGYQQGDNPLAMREAEELAALEKSLFEELASIKVAPRNKTGKK